MNGEIQCNSEEIVSAILPHSSFILEPHPRVGLIERKQALKQLRMKLDQLPRLLEEAFRTVGEQLGAIFSGFFVQKYLVTIGNIAAQVGQFAIKCADPMLADLM